MALTYSSMLELGTQMPKFELENTVNNEIFSTSYFNSTTPKLVMFICNHCPYVIHYHKELTKLSPLDIYADENSRNLGDLKIIKDSFDGINIKLMKCGSIEEAMNMISVAKKYKLKIMLGCMVETSIGITAASCLASAVDKVDLDGNLLITNDPYSGVKVINGYLSLPNLLGLGLKLKNTTNSLLK